MEKVFKPNFNFVSTYGILVMCAIIIFILSFYISSLGKKGKIGMLEAVISSVLLFLLACVMIFFLGIYHTFSYEVNKECIILRCGPFKSKIQYKDIKRISRVDDLGFPVAGLKLPSYFLTNCYFQHYGWITMYATRNKDVVIIETDKKKYGITPQNTEEFISTLNEKLK